MTTVYTYANLSARDVSLRSDQLCDLIVDSVPSGAPVGFLSPVAPKAARDYWAMVAHEVHLDHRGVIVALDPDDRAVGVVQLVWNLGESQPHRAEVSKLLVLSTARRAGLGAGLMTRLHDLAEARSKTLLTLYTDAGSAAERLYAKLGWSQVGTVPDFALRGDGRPAAATFFFKQLNQEDGSHAIAPGGVEADGSIVDSTATHCAVKPPSILNSAPVMNLDSSEAR